jgi:hypothetical protein
MEKFVTQVQFVGMAHTYQRPTSLREAITELVQDESGKVVDLLPILGDRDNDLIVICNFPSINAATKAWLALGARYGWKTQTNPSPEFDQFQRIYEDVNNVSEATRLAAGSPSTSHTGSR